MTGQLTAGQVAANLAELGRTLDRLVKDLDVAEVNAVNAREDYTLALSTAFLEAEGAMDIRKHTSIRDTTQARIRAELAEVTVRGLRRQIDSVKVRVEIGRSVSAVIRSEVSLAGSGIAA